MGPGTLNNEAAPRLPKAKRNCALCLVLVLALSVAGCIKDSGRDTCPGNYIEILPTIAQGRITGNSFDPGDRIGLFVSVSPGIPDPDNYAYNMAYTFDGTRWTAPGGMPLPWPGAAPLDVYAYWPYDTGLSTGNPRAYAFTAGTDQTTPENYILNDFLWARAGRRPAGQSVPLLFSHSLSRVRVNIVSSFDAGDGWPQGAEVALMGLSRETTIDLTDGTAAWEGARSGATDRNDRVLKGLAAVSDTPLPREENDILPLVLDTPAPGYELSLAAIVVPQIFTADNPLVRITLDGEEYVFIPSADFYLLPGQTLSVNLTLTDQPPGLILDMDQIDWNRSRVWNVYDGSTIVAQVCREYLQGPSAPDVQAEVVYLASAGGADFSSGFAARVYQRGKNGTGGYDVDPANVHGGGVDFTAQTLYSQGVLAPVRKVAVDPGVGIFGSYPAATTNLTVQPVTVSDYDGNTYPVVKINGWYWTASNIRTTRYMNGNVMSGIPYGNDPANTATYGLLYSGYDAYAPQPILSGPWHLPYVTDYRALADYLQPAAGSKLKANVLWAPSDLSNDVTGFGLLPGGFRQSNGTYSQLGTTGYLWTDTFDGFLGDYYTATASSDAFDTDQVSHELYMSVRLLLTDPSALTTR